MWLPPLGGRTGRLQAEDHFRPKFSPFHRRVSVGGYWTRMTGFADEASVQARSAHLPKDLGLVDLTLTQVLFIVGLPWVGVAAKQGPAHVVLWLAAIVFFY